MTPLEIEEALSKLAETEFNPAEFPYAFLEVFGNKATTIKRLKSGGTNKTDIEGAVLQYNNVHISVCSSGNALQALDQLRASPATQKHKVKFILTTDGKEFQAEDLNSGKTIVCEYQELADDFGFWAALAGISYTQELKETKLDRTAARRLNKLYLELLKENPEWGTKERRHDMNHFMARLIFCFFAEDTDIFKGKDLFTTTVGQMSAKDSSDTDKVIGKVFRAMNTKVEDREKAKLPRWANEFPYVNGGLFSGSTETPRFSKIAKVYLLHVGKLDWQLINPDIFGSMIQAVADDEERGALGMHYTSVPNILKVLNPLFLDDLRTQLEEAEDNPRKLLNLRKRMAKIRVFDPACGSGNFLVIAYKQMREIEAEINKRRGEENLSSKIPLTNFRGIELRSFSAEVARLALIIAEYQCDVLYRGQKLALAEFLPLNTENWITHGNALLLDWLSICPPTGKSVKMQGDDLFSTPEEQAEVDFKNEGGETYICGNPPYAGSTVKAPKGASKEQKERLKKEDKKRKSDLKTIFGHRTKTWKLLDYVAGWLMKAADYGTKANATSAFVATNSICQGQQVPSIWPLIFETGHKIVFAHTSFKWSNLAANNAGVTVVIVGLSRQIHQKRRLYTLDGNDITSVKETGHINAYLTSIQDTIIKKRSEPFGELNTMTKGNAPTDGGFLLLNKEEIIDLNLTKMQQKKIVRRFVGSYDSINGKERFCLWMSKSDAESLSTNKEISERLSAVKKMRLNSSKKQTQTLAQNPYSFGEIRQNGNELPIVIPRHSSESREYLPFTLGNRGDIIADSASSIYNAPLWNVAVYTSRLHLVWIAAVCGKIKTDYRYSNTLGWNTFPVPQLTEKNKADLTRCAEDILLAREAHFPATIADLYNPDNMPEDLRHAHERNDEVLERIYIGRRFKNDTERLEKLFELYTEMTKKEAS